MPPTNLMLTVEQCRRMYAFVRQMRDTKPILFLDFQNDGEFVGGCIAGGRRYLHINAAGDVEPCVFVHYSNANIHDKTLLECLQSPESGAHCTDLQTEEMAEHLCGKCRKFAEEWAPVAEELWFNPGDARHSCRVDITANMAETDKAKFKE